MDLIVLAEPITACQLARGSPLPMNDTRSVGLVGSPSFRAMCSMPSTISSSERLRTGNPLPVRKQNLQPRLQEVCVGTQMMSFPSPFLMSENSRMLSLDSKTYLIVASSLECSTSC